MSQEEYTELNALLDAVAQQDVHLGRVLSAIVSHLPGYSEAAAAKAEADAAAAKEAAAQAEAEAAPVEAVQPEAVPSEEQPS